MLELVTIPVSHYCEKARWALHRAGLDFFEHGHLPFFSKLATWRSGKVNSVPLLVTPDRLLTQSAEIVAWADAHSVSGKRLFPEHLGRRAEVEALVARLDADLGPATRRLAYSGIIHDRATVLALMDSVVPRGELALMKLGYPLARRLLTRGLGLTAEGVARSRGKLARLCDELDARLADGRRWLTGETFSAADLTFAALAAPIFLPDGYGGPLPRRDQLSPAIQTEVDALRARPVGKLGLRAYQLER
jgi:glutathione S-transferase